MSKWRSTPIVCLALLLGPVSAGRMVQTARASYALSVTPASPTTQDVITLTLAGTWSDDAPPNKLRAELKEGNIYIDMLLPGAEDGKVPVSKPIKTDWQATTTIGPLAAGTYKVYTRGVAYGQTGGYVKMGQIQVVSAASPTDPGEEKPKTPSEPPLKPEPSPPSPGNEPKPSPPSPGKEPKPSPPSEVITSTGLEPGVCVTLMDAALASESGLGAGQGGTIVSGEKPSHAGRILVSWYFYGQGTNERCADAEGLPVAIGLKSARWVDTKTVRLALCFDQSGTLSQGKDDSVLLTTPDGRRYNLIGAHLLSEKIGPTGQFHFGDRVRVQGLLQACGPRAKEAALYSKQNGDVHGPIISLHIPPTAKFNPPDRVVLLVDNPAGLDGNPATGLRAGTKGTIVAIDPAQSNPVFVSWDGFTKGLNANAFSPPPVPPSPPKSGWPVKYDQIAPSSEARGPCAGDTLTVNMFDGRVWLRRDPQCPGGKHTLADTATLGIERSEAAILRVLVVPSPGIGGTWKASLSTDTVRANTPTEVKISIDVIDINLSDIRTGENVLAASVNFWSQSR